MVIRGGNRSSGQRYWGAAGSVREHRGELYREQRRQGAEDKCHKMMG